MTAPFRLALILSFAAGCYLPPSATNAPLRSPEGVAVTLVGQDCEDHRGADSDPVSREVGVKVRFDNATDHSLRIAERAIRLVVGDYTAWVRSPGVVDVKPHDSATVVMDFTHHTLCARAREFVINWDQALSLDDRPIAVANLAFRP
jgi:hypothetical protein